MSAKKEVKATTKAAPAAEAKKSKVDQASKIKRNADGSKKMKVARGTERARRRQDLVQGWRRLANLKQMLPPAGTPAVEAQ